MSSSAAALPPGDGTRPEPPTNLVQSGCLVLGPGAKKEQGNGGAALSKLSAAQAETVQRAKKYAMEQSFKMVLMKQTLSIQQQQAKTYQRQQAVVLLCRIYVGSINFEVREDALRQAFLPFGPLRSVSMSWDPISQKHKGFAFVEFEIPEAAQLALEQMNGVVMSGRNIKVGRPSNMPQAQAVIEEVLEDGKTFNRIYVASIHQDLTEDDIKSVFEAFGPIKDIHLALTPYPGRHKGYCFIEYATSQAAQDAISSMNLFDLGGQFLRVGRAMTPPNTFANVGPLPSSTASSLPTAAAVAAAAATAKIQAMDAVASNLGIKPEAAATTIVSPASSSAPIMAAAASSSSRTSSRRGFGARAAGADIPPPTVANIPSIAAASAVTAASTPAVAPPPAAVPAPPPVPPAAPPAPAAPTPAPPPPPEDSAEVAQARHDPAAMLAKLEAEEYKTQQQELQKKIGEGMDMSSLRQQENLSIKGQEARHLVMQKLMRTQSESVVVLLKNMVGPEEVDEELQEEIEEECGKFGAVERVIIYQERQSEEEDAEVIVKIFVEFKAHDGARQAKEKLHGRFFGGRKVIAEIYDQDLYDHNDLSG